MSKTKLTVNGVELSYIEYGRGNEEVLIMCHFYYETFEGLLASLAERFHVYALNARVQGKVTEERNDGYPDWPAQWADDTVAFARALNLGPFLYAGQSHGSAIGWQILYRHPAALKGLVSLGGFAPHIVEDPEQKQRLANLLAEILSENPAHFRRMLTRESGTLYEDTMRAWGAIDKTHLKGFSLDHQQLTTNAAIEAWLRTVDVPVLVIVGASDEIARDMFGDAGWLMTARAIPNAKVVTYQNEGHYMFAENPAAMADDVKLFADQIGRKHTAK